MWLFNYYFVNGLNKMVFGAILGIILRMVMPSMIIVYIVEILYNQCINFKLLM